MLPNYLKKAIKDWKNFCKIELPSIFEQVKEIKHRQEIGEINEEEARELINEAKIPMIVYGIRPTEKRIVINNKQHLYRHRIRQKINKGLQDLKLVLEHIEDLNAFHKWRSDPIIDPQLMDEILLLWMKARKSQWVREKCKEYKEGNTEVFEGLESLAEYEPPELDLSPWFYF